MYMYIVSDQGSCQLGVNLYAEEPFLYSAMLKMMQWYYSIFSSNNDLVRWSRYVNSSLVRSFGLRNPNSS